MSFFKRLFTRIKNWIHNLRIVMLRNLISSFYKILRKHTPRKIKKSEFNSLSPAILTGSTFRYYNNVLLWAMNQSDCLNIAVSGIYGAGKSSIIKTFVDNNRQFEVLPISLGTFKEKTLDDEDLSKPEKVILQQILYRVDAKKIPDSRFRRVTKQNKVNIFGNYVRIVSILLLLYILFKPLVLCYTPFSSLYENYLLLTRLTIGFFVLILSWTYFKQLQGTLKRISVEKLNLKNGEIHLKSDSNESIFNNYLDELVYFFDKNRFDIVIFEDLDRFNNLEIFIRLRELNLILNQNESIKKKGKITFLYAVKDDLFKDTEFTERVKFFDFILPVISVINSSNSYPKLKDLLTEKELQELEGDYLIDISYYISDLRLLKNICNEYRVFQHLVRDQHSFKYAPEKIFSIVMYKNLFPSDFNQLTRGYGKVHKYLSFEFKSELIDSMLSVIDEEIAGLNEKIDTIKKYKDIDEIELKVNFLALYIQTLSRSYNAFHLNNSRLFFDGVNQTHFDTIYSSDIQGYQVNVIHPSVIPSKLADLKDSTGNTYAERKKNIGSERTIALNGLKLEIESLTNKKAVLKNKPIRSLFEDASLQLAVLELKKENPFLHHCLINGFIDENYQLYLSHYIKGGLTVNDINFVQYVNEGIYLDIDFSYNLSLIDQLLNRISKDKYSSTRILNFQLLDYALEYENTDLIKGFTLQINEWKASQQKFYLEYFERDMNVISLNRKLLLYYPQFFTKILSHSYSNELKTRIVLLILLNSDEEFSNKIKESKELINFLIANQLLLDKDYIKTSDLENLCKQFNLKFRSIENSNNHENIEMVISRQFYDLTYSNILFVINGSASIEQDENHFSPEESFYSFIRKSNNTDLIDYVHEDIEDFISNVYLKLEQQQIEDQDYLIELLNIVDNVDLSSDIISKNETKINDLRSIDKREDIAYLIEERKVIPTWESIFESLKKLYDDESDSINLNEIELNEEFFNFINDSVEINIPDFSISEITNVINSIDLKFFKLKLISDQNLDDVAFEKIVHSCNVEFINDIKYVDLSHEKIEILIDQQKLNLTEESFSYLKENFDELSEKLLVSKFDVFLQDVTLFALNEIHIEAIIESGIIDNSKKIKFLQSYDLPFSEDGVLSKSVLQFANKHFAMLDWDFVQCENLIKHTDHSDQTILKQFFIKTFEAFSLTSQQLVDLVKGLKITPFTNLFDLSKGTTEAFGVSKENKKILEFLNKRGIVGKIRVKTSKILIYKKHI